ncbi:MAG: ubiquinol oxidase [Patescibacteria group bacterium]|nr:ubiquinol oxidase [Patescibacteria group bacterium]
MNSQENDESPNKFEKLIKDLRDEKVLEEYKASRDNYKTSFLPNLLGGFLVWCGNVVYGREPSYLKFRAVEVIARVPYQSWASAAYTLLTIFYTDEAKAMRLGHVKKFSRLANDNETMHVVVISSIAKHEHKHVGVLRHTIIPMLFSFFYFWMSYCLFLVKREWSYELNYLFESHAFSQYSTFIKRHAEGLKNKPLENEFLKQYGRTNTNYYDFFLDVRSDEIVHRNSSIEKIEQLSDEEKEMNLWFIVLIVVLVWVVAKIF